MREGVRLVAIIIIGSIALGLLATEQLAGACDVVGAGGLGDLAIRYGYQRFQTDVMLVTVALMILLVQLIQFAGDHLSRRFDYR